MDNPQGPVPHDSTYWRLRTTTRKRAKNSVILGVAPETCPPASETLNPSQRPIKQAAGDDSISLGVLALLRVVVNICGTFFFLCSILDGYSRFLVHWEIRETMTEAEVETILQRAREQFPGERPRIISDNGPQFIARDFKEFIRICGMTHVRTSPHYLKSNGKMERWFKTLKGECIRVKTPLSLEDARRLVAEFVNHYNTVRLHSAIAYITPADKLAGRAEAIWAARKQKLATANARRRAKAEKEGFAQS